MTARIAYTVQETAEALGVSADLVYDLCDRGELRFVRAGRRKLIRAESLAEWIERNSTPPPNGPNGDANGVATP
jgi:excisionase family DNA binding protein